jgi:hypothetical protein
LLNVERVKYTMGPWTCSAVSNRSINLKTRHLAPRTCKPVHLRSNPVLYGGFAWVLQHCWCQRWHQHSYLSCEINIFLFGAPNIAIIYQFQSSQWDLCNGVLHFVIWDNLFRIKLNIFIKQVIFYSHLQPDIYVVMIKC